MNQRPSLHLKGAPKGLEFSLRFGILKPYWEPETRMFASHAAVP